MRLPSGESSLILSYLQASQRESLLAASQKKEYSRGSVLKIEQDDAHYYVLESGSAEILFKSGRSAVYLEEGSSFGHLPYLQSGECYEIKFTRPGRLVILSDEAIMTLLFSSLQMIRGYLRALQRSGRPMLSTASLPFTGTEVIAVAGSRKSGSTLFSLFAGGYLKEAGKVLILHLSTSESSVFQFLNLETPPSIFYTRAENFIFDVHAQSVELDANLFCINAAPLEGDTVDAALLAPLLLRAAENFDFIIVDCDLHLLSEQHTPLYDSIITVENPRSDYELVCSMLDSSVENGQLVYRTANLFHGERGAENYKLRFPHIELMMEGEVLDHLQSARLDFLDMHKSRDLACAYCTPALYSSAAYLTLIEKSYASVYVPGLSCFLFAVFLLFSRNEAVDIITDFYKVERQKLMYKLVYPDEMLFSNSYIVSYMKSVFKTRRIEDSPVKLLVPLQTEDGRRIHLSTGSAADIAAAAIMLRPYFQPVEINGIPCYRDEGADPCEIFQQGFSKVDVYALSTHEHQLPFKNESLIANILKGIGGQGHNADFIIDPPDMSLHGIHDFLSGL